MSKRELTSAFEIEDKVRCYFIPNHVCEIIAIRFTFNKVRYDLEVILDELKREGSDTVYVTAIKNVDSAFISPIE